MGGQSHRTVESAIVTAGAMQDSNVANVKNPARLDVGAESAGDMYDPRSGNGGYTVSHYDLALDYRINTNRLAAVAVLSAVSTQRLARFSLDLVGLTVTNVVIDGARAARYSQAHGKLVITPARPIAAKTNFTVTVRYSGSPSPRSSSWGDVGWEELSDGVLVAGQPSGAATWFPCNDHPSIKATFRIAITLASSYRAVANGRLVSATVKSSRTQWIYESAEPMATYLATVQIGAYRSRPLSARGGIPQLAFIPGDLVPEFDADFGAQSAMISEFEKLFGPYPFGQYTVVVADDDLDIPLEAQGLSIFGRNHVDGDGGSTRLIAHELAHSWFGNSLTASSWKHIWLHEGFACYAEWLWSEAAGGPNVQRIAVQQWNRLHSLDEDFRIGDPGPDRMFDDRLYKRGALTVHAVRLTLGDDVFFTMLKAWAAENQFGSVSTEQFIGHVEAYTELPIRTTLESWLFNEKLPPLPSKR
jgi:aminopeptidase N